MATATTPRYRVSSKSNPLQWVGTAYNYDGTTPIDTTIVRFRGSNGPDLEDVFGIYTALTETLRVAPRKALAYCLRNWPEYSDQLLNEESITCSNLS